MKTTTLIALLGILAFTPLSLTHAADSATDEDTQEQPIEEEEPSEDKDA